MEKISPYPNSLRQHIETAGYTFKEVAQKANISQRTLYHWAGGHRIIPLDETRLSEQRGTCFVHLKQPDLAIVPLYEALAQHSTPSRRKGMILNQLALASLQQLDVEQACTYAHEVISIALQSSSGVLKKGLTVLRPQLESFAETDSVKQLDQHLRLLV